MKVIITDKLADEGVKILEDAGYEINKAWDIPKNDLPSIIGNYDGIVIRSATKMKGALLEAATSCKVIGRAGVGLDNVDVAKAESMGIKVRNTPAATSISVGEHAFALMIGLAHQIGMGTHTLKQGKWEKKALKGSELYGKKLGLIGGGRIGSEMAKRAICFGMDVIIYDIIENDVKINIFGTEKVVKLVSFDELLASSDYISLHLPLTEKTKHLIDKPQFDKMKKGVCIIDASRGGIINQKALLNALNEGKVNKAAVDVFETEPIGEFEKELLKSDSVIGTPHLGAQTAEGQLRAGIQVAEVVIEELKKL